MLNLGTYRHMTVERYLRYLTLLETLRTLDDSREYFIREIYLLLDPQDQVEGPRQALISRLKRDRVLCRNYRALPVRYALHKDRIDAAKAHVETALKWSETQQSETTPSLASLS